MKKIFTLLAITFLFFGSKAVSQTTTDCNAKFTYKISGDTVQFIPAAGTDSSFIYHHWKFGDTTSALLFAYAPTHIYPGPGTYVVTQYIAKSSNSNGSPSCSDSSKDTIIIAQQCNIKPAFTWIIDTLTSTVYFTNTTFLPSQLAVPSTWYFGDDSSSSTWEANHTYAKPGKYYVCLRLQLGTTCVGYQCDSITIPAPACNTKASYTWKVDSLKANTIDFTNTTILPPTLNPLPVGYSIWIFGDGSALDSSFNATHTYTQAGKYYVCLRVQTGANCLSYQCDSITVPSPVVCNLQAYFNDLPDSLQYNKIHFTDYTTNLATTDSSYWTFGDSTTSRDVNPIHVYANPGTYNVCLTIKRITTSGAVPCTSTFCRTVTITSPTCKLLVNYSYKIDSAVTTTPNTYQFTNLSSPIASTDSSYWVFGDGTTSHDINPVHTFAQGGTYTVCLYVKTVSVAGIVSCSGDTCKTITITTPCDFKIGYTWTLDSVNKNEVHFTNTSAVPTTASVRWAYGDGSALDSTWNATHVFAQPGTYYVCLRIQVNPNCVKYQCDSITIPAPIVCNLQAYFNDLPDSLLYNKIHFTDYTTNLATTDSSYWTFGDSATSRDLNPTHIYAPGTYNACLTITRIATPGTVPCTSKFCRTIVIASTCNLTANFTYYRDSLSASPVNNLYRFTNTSTPENGYDSSFWNFGDGTNISYDKNPSHAFATSGTYTVCLYVKKASNSATVAPCVSSVCETIVIPSSVCNIKASYTWRLDPTHANTVDFTNTTLPAPTTTVTSARWSFGDGSAIDSTWNATHIYAQAGKYYVCLRVQTSATCVSYQCDSITVSAQVVPTCQQLSLFTIATPVLNKQYFVFAPTYPATDVQYTWTFGDNDGSQNITTSHHYTNPGVYTVCLTAYRDSNCASTTCKEITVRPEVNCDSINVNFNYYQNGNEPNMVYFYTRLNFPVTQQSWTITSLTNASTSPIILNRTNPVFVFTDTGYYNVCMHVTTIGGCIKEYCKTIHIASISAPCQLFAYPNPTHTQVTLNVQLATPEMIHAYVYTSQNTLLMQTEQQGNTGNNIVTINTANLAAGFYTIKLIYGNNTCYAKFQKL